MVPLRCDHIFFSSPHYLVKKKPQKFCSAADHSSEHSFRTEASGHSQAHGDLRPAGASPLLRAPQLTAQWHAGNSSYQLERRWWTEHLIFLLFLSNCAQTCMQSVSCQPDSAENIAFLWCNSWSKDRESRFVFFLSYDWSASPQNFLSYILKLSRCSMWCLTVGAKTVDDSGALRKIVSKYQGQNFPNVPNFLSVITVKISYLACMFSENPASHVKYWPLYLKTLEAALSAEQAWHLIEIPLWC